MPKPRGPSATFANLVCRFGDQFVLLDFAEDIVIPALMDGELKRKHGDTSYFFWNATMALIPAKDSDVPFVVIYGKLVKNTTLKRQQEFIAEKGLVRDPAELASAPSSFFIVILNSHKLIYFGETDQAPTVPQFEAMLQHKRPCSSII